MTKTLQLVCHPSWMRDEIAAAGIRMHHSYGIEIPEFAPDDIWWMPQGFAVELNKALEYYGRERVELISPGNELLPSVPEKYTKRIITKLTAAEALASPKDGWWKSAEAKIDTFPSKYRTSSEISDDIHKAELPSDAVLHYTPTILPLAREFRSFVSNGRVTTTSVYLVIDGENQTTVYDGAKSLPGDIERVESFLETVFSEVDIPPSVVVDTAILVNSDLALLEFNPSWCSAWYDNDLNAVVASIECGFDLDEPTLAAWRYVPDSYFADKISRKPVLPKR